MIYVIGESRTGVVKVGYSRNPVDRLRDIRVSNPANLSVQVAVPGERVDETWLHHRLSSRRMRGEWFDFGPDDAVASVLLLIGERPIEWQPAPPPQTETRKRGYERPRIKRGDTDEQRFIAREEHLRAVAAAEYADRLRVPRLFVGRRVIMADRDATDYARLIRLGWGEGRMTKAEVRAIQDEYESVN